jgi:hypothetical protein
VRCRRAFGPDHAITLMAAVTLTGALLQRSDAESARTLGEDTLQRSRRALGPDHPITLYLIRAASISDLMLGDDAAEDGPSRRQ